VTEAFSHADFDFGWLTAKLVPGARHYELARHAVIQASLVLPLKRHPEANA